MLRDTMVDNLLQGTPAYICAKLHKGDEIVSVDMQPVSPDNVKRLIIGATRGPDPPPPQQHWQASSLFALVAPDT